MYRALLYIPRRKPVVVTPTIKKRAITHGTGHMIGSSDPVSLISCFSNPKAFTACTTYESPSGMRGGVSTTCIEIKTPGLLECTALDVIASPAFGAEIISFSYIGVCLWAQKKKKKRKEKDGKKKTERKSPPGLHSLHRDEREKPYKYTPSDPSQRAIELDCYSEIQRLECRPVIGVY